MIDLEDRDLSAELRVFRGSRPNRNIDELDRLQHEASTILELNGIKSANPKHDKPVGDRQERVG